MGLAFVEFWEHTSVNQTEREAFGMLAISCAMVSSLLVWRFSSEDYQVTKFSGSFAPLLGGREG